MQLNEQIMLQVAEQTFEAMTFSIIETPLKEEKPDLATVICARLRFAGAFSGKIILSVLPEILPDLSRDMLGEEENYIPLQKEQFDVLGELLNVLCANLLNALEGPEAIFDLDTPQVREVKNIAVIREENENQKTIVLWFDQGWAELTLIPDN